MATSIPLLVTRLALAGLLLLTGSAKLTRRDATRVAATELGVPAKAASAAAYALPLVELASAAAMLLPPSGIERAGAGLALLLGACLTAVVARALMQGRRPECGCFGILVRTRIGGGTLALDAAMTAAALLVAVYGPGRATAVHGAAAAVLPLAAALLVLVPLASAAHSAVAELRKRCESLDLRLKTLEAAARLSLDGETPVGGPEAGVPAPLLHVTDLEGNERQLTPRATEDDELLLVLFLEPGCSPCERLMAEAAAWRRATASRLGIWIILGDTASHAAEAARMYGLDDHVYAQPARRAADAYRIPGSPAGVLIDRAGLVTVPLIAGLNAIHDVLDRWASSLDPV